MGRTLQLKIARVFERFLQPSRYKGAHGGRGGAKSHVFAELLVERCMLEPTRAVCVREIQNSLEQSVKRLVEDKIKVFGVESMFRIMNTHIEAPNDGIIIFNGMQNHTADSIKSLEGYDVAWVEEAQSLSERSLTLLRPTIRKPNSELWFSWNPANETDPVDKLLRSKNPPPDAVVIHSTYHDNPWFPDVLRAEMEWDRENDIEKYTHVWLGGYEKHSEARVFKNWKVEEFEVPDDAVLMLGGDWGFSTDPTVLANTYEKRPTAEQLKANPATRTKLYISHEVYRVGCEIDHTPRLFDGLFCGCTIQKDGSPQPEPCRNPQKHALARKLSIVADSARPETISYLRRHDYPRIEPAVKGANSVKEGVIFLQGYDIIIHPRCTHTIDEFTMYSYVVDKQTTIVTNVLEDKKNHVIDSVRYAAERARGGRLRVRETVYG